MTFIERERPWLAMYNVYLKPPAPPPQHWQEGALLSLIPSELFHAILLHCQGRHISIAAESCKALQEICREPEIFQHICETVFAYCPEKYNRSLLKQYGGWRGMFYERPRVRLDGIYAVRMLTVKYGTNEGKGMKEGGEDFFKPYHNMIHTRYLRFYPDGSLITCLSAEQPAKVLRNITLLRRSGQFRGNIGLGTFVVRDRVVETKFGLRLDTHPAMEPFEQIIRVEIQSTRRGAWNRLKMLQHCAEQPTGEVVEFKRPNFPFRFVPFDDFSARVEAMPLDNYALHAAMTKKPQQAAAE